MAKKQTKQQKNPTRDQKLADNIVSRLFINGCGDAANRLILHNGVRDLGGWNRDAVYRQVIEAVRDVDSDPSA